MSELTREPGPFGAELDAAARAAGGWADDKMVYAVEVISQGEDPQILLTGSAATWMHRAKRWKFFGPSVKAVVRLSEYRAALPKARGESV